MDKRILTGGIFVMFIFLTAMDIQDMITDGTISMFDYDFEGYSFIWLVFDFAILFASYHDTWGRGRK